MTEEEEESLPLQNFDWHPWEARTEVSDNAGRKKNSRAKMTVERKNRNEDSSTSRSESEEYLILSDSSLDVEKKSFKGWYKWKWFCSSWLKKNN